MDTSMSFIERQFPVSKVSKESFKERKAVQSQTLTGMCRWWGRKLLILVRAAILGCVLPATDNPHKDMEMFIRLLGMDESALALRQEKRLSVADLYTKVCSNHRLKNKFAVFFNEVNGKITIEKDAPRGDIENAVFKQLSYDEKLALCIRPEQLRNISDQSWAEINNYYGTDSYSLQAFIEQLSLKRYGHTIKVGDCFCGGGSIPFEAARIGCDTYASDLNPIAGLLTWSSINLCGVDKKAETAIEEFRDDVLKR